MTIFDTDTVTLLSHGNPKISGRISRLPEDEQLAITVITQMQILGGRYATLRTAANEAELKMAMMRFQEAETLIRRFSILPVDDGAAIEFERLRGTKSKKVKAIGREDLLIACIALAQKALLVTRNAKDFRLINGLQHENWAD
jgi:predicted nucleic acid-binding protein